MAYCIDLVLATKPCLIYDLAFVEPFSCTCDYSSVNFSILCPSVPKPNSSLCFCDFRHADYSSLISYLLDIDSLLLYNTSLNVDESKISQVLKDSISQFVPLCYIHPRQSSVPKYIRSLLLKKIHWYSKNKLMYKKYAHAAVKSYFSSKELDIAYSKNVIRFYAYANSKLNSLMGIPPLLNDDGTLAICDSTKCELLNKYFY